MEGKDRRKEYKGRMEGSGKERMDGRIEGKDSIDDLYVH